MALLLREADVAAVLSMGAAIGIMERALAAFSTGGVLQPVRLALGVEPHTGYLGLMPAHLRSASGAGEALGAKAVTFYTRNAGAGLPTHMAVILLWDPATGALLSLMDGRLITEMRTGATSAVATKVLARHDASVLALLGSGVQARSHLEALGLVRPLREARVWSRTRAHAEALAREMGDRARIRVCATAEEAVRGSDLIVTATSSPSPILRGEWIAPGAHINAVGAPRPDWRELDTAAVARARLFVDSRAGVLAESGDVAQPLKEGAIDEAHILGEIGEVLAGRLSGRMAPSDITLFKSLGMAVEDVATAAYVYVAAREQGIGQEVQL